mmetsp:Transcript_42128/g.70306  ORF Transcript_42128/g.70306 Transcript_42128/m.70306 type:complete len:332 (+) Transcript_42128:735-1730(+)
MACSRCQRGSSEIHGFLLTILDGRVHVSSPRWSPRHVSSRRWSTCHLLSRHFLFVVINVEERPGGLLLAVLHGVHLVNARAVVGGVAAECDAEVFQEEVHAGQQTLRGAGPALDGRHAFVHDDAIRQIRGHNEVVLHDERRLLRVHDEALDRLSGDDALLGVEVRTGLVDEVDVGSLAQAQRDGHALQLSTGKVLDVLVHDIIDHHGFHDVGDELRVHVRLADLGVEHGAHGHLALRGDLLRLVRHVELGDLAARVFVGRQHTRQHADEGRLACSVLPEHDNDLGVREVTGLHVQHKLAVLILLEVGVIEAVELLLLIIPARGVVRHLEGE